MLYGVSPPLKQVSRSIPDSRLKFFLEKLKFRWLGQFRVLDVFLYGVIELMNEKTEELFKVNGKIVKLYLGDQSNQGDPLSCRIMKHKIGPKSKHNKRGTSFVPTQLSLFVSSITSYFFALFPFYL